MSRVRNPVQDDDKIDKEEMFACHSRGACLKSCLQR
jgi:hypothetical protein